MMFKLMLPQPPLPPSSSSTTIRRNKPIRLEVCCKLLLLLLSMGCNTNAASPAAAASDLFYELRFYNSVNKAMESVKQILDTTRNPKLAMDDMDHKYNDKFALAEFLTNTVIAALTNVFETLLGLDDPTVFRKIWDVVHNDKRSIAIRFQGEQTTHFLKEKEVDVVTNERETQMDDIEITTDGEVKEKTQTTTTRINHKLLVNHWKVDLKIELQIVFGADGENVITLLERESSRNYITTGDRTTGKNSNKNTQKKVFDPLEVNLTWLFQILSTNKDDDNNKVSQFSIDRSDPETCRTPRRNMDINKAIDSLVKIQAWFNRLIIFFDSDVRDLHAMGGYYNGGAIHNPQQQIDYHGRYREFLNHNRKLAQSLFHPTLPLLENSTVLSDLDLTLLLNHQLHRIEQAKKQLEDDQKVYPSSLISATEAEILLACFYTSQLINQYIDSVNYIEYMLRTQLIRAIGKEVTAQDFDGFMKLHHQKLFAPGTSPNLFVYSIRRDIDHYPDGTLCIEARTTEMTKAKSDGSGGDAVEPVQTFVRKIPYNATTTPPPIHIPINAATSVEIRGDRYLHGWLQHHFGGTDRITNFRLTARANQFSNFVLLVGTMGGGGTQFQPNSAIILQNKDELLIPLLTEVIPSAKEFKDAIASLSPTQQNFAKAFRAMQLESSVFGVCVIQLKPQLERLLGLPKSSLLKEIQLTQDLMSLFVDYQIPSDLLSVTTHDAMPGISGSPNSSTTTKSTTQQKLNCVKENVQAVKDVIQNAKEEQLENEKLKKEMLKQKKYESPFFPAPISNAGDVGTPNPTHFISQMPSGTIASRYTQEPTRDDCYGNMLDGRFCSSEMPSVSDEPTVGQAPVIQAPSGQTGFYTKQGETTTTLSRKDGCRGSTTTTATAASVDHDFTLLPKILDSQIERLDPDGSLRSTIVKPDKNRWERTRKENLLMPSIKEALSNRTIEQEQKKAFDLLDALSRSGSLPIDQSELHIVVVLSHCFEDDLMSTVISENVNPIEKVERSCLLLASTIHGGIPIKELVGDDVTLEQRRLIDALSPIIDDAQAESEVD